MVGTPPTARCAPGCFAHPHMGICKSRPRIDPDQVWHDGRAARGAMRSAARRPGLGQGLASEDCCSSQHHLISGRIVVRAHFPHACGEEANEDETHLRNGIGWPLGGTVIIHPARSAAEPRRRLWYPVLCLHGCSGGNKPGGEIAPQRHDQFARERNNGDAPGALAGVGSAGVEPAAEFAFRLMPQP